MTPLRKSIIRDWGAMKPFGKKTFVYPIFIIVFFLFLWSVPEVPGNDLSLPYVSPRMERPQFWIGKVQNPGDLLLNPDQIQKMNDDAFKRPDLFLCRVKDLKEEWSREELLDLLREDWQGFGETSESRFGRGGHPLGESFWKELKNNINESGIKSQTRILFGLITRRTDIRVFPTDKPSFSSRGNGEFDRFQHSMIAPGSLVALYHISKDKQWGYFQVPFIRGWVKLDSVAVAKERDLAVQYEEAKERLLVTGNFIPFCKDPSLREEALMTQMGSSFPLVRTSQNDNEDAKLYTVKVPDREKGGQLGFRNLYIPRGADVQSGFLPYTQTHVALQAFKMIHEPYGWGELSGGRDCSRFILDLFATFGIIMPRNSKFQAQMGIGLGELEGKTTAEKRKILDQAPPLATVLRLPGHIMLYLGKHQGRYYIIHSIWGFQKTGPSGPILQKIGRVAVSDLSLGEQGPHGSLLERITDIRFIGDEKNIQKYQPEFKE